MSFVINPFTKTVTPWRPEGPFLQALRDTIQCTQVDSIMIQRGLVAWVDNFGLLRDPQRFFRFKDSAFRFAGIVIITGTDADGLPCDTGDSPLDAIAGNTDWCEGLKVERIHEELRVEPTDLGPWPRVVRVTEFNQPPPDLGKPAAAGPYSFEPVQIPVAAPDQAQRPPQAVNGAVPEESPTAFEETVPLMVWTVTSDDATDSFVAVETDVAGIETGKQLRFKEMAAVAQHFAEAHAERIADDPDTPDEVIARFVTPA